MLLLMRFIWLRIQACLTIVLTIGLRPPLLPARFGVLKSDDDQNAWRFTTAESPVGDPFVPGSDPRNALAVLGLNTNGILCSWSDRRML